MQQFDMTAVVQRKATDESQGWVVSARETDGPLGDRDIVAHFQTHPYLNAKTVAVEYARMKFSRVEVKD